MRDLDFYQRLDANAERVRRGEAGCILIRCFNEQDMQAIRAYTDEMHPDIRIHFSYLTFEEIDAAIAAGGG